MGLVSAHRHKLIIALVAAAVLATSVATAVVVASDDDKPEVVVRCRSDRSDVASTTSSTLPNAAVTVTAIVHVRPVDADGCLLNSFRVKETVENAGCVIPKGFGPYPRADPSRKVVSALRCGAGDFGFDPCWLEPGASKPSVVCMYQPWQDHVIRLLTGPEELEVSLRTEEFGAPWAVELADGQRCLVGIGAHDLFGDDAVDYLCQDSGPGELVLLRGFDQSAPLWKARAARYIDGAYRHELPQTIVTAWF